MFITVGSVVTFCAFSAHKAFRVILSSIPAIRLRPAAGRAIDLFLSGVVGALLSAFRTRPLPQESGSSVALIALMRAIFAGSA